MSEINWIRRIPGYHYYDTPEDEDCLKKVFFMNKVGLFFGLTFGTVDIIALSKPVGFGNIAARYALVTFPLLATGSAYAAATCITANYRGKLDYLNSTIGGAVAGCTFGAVLRSGPIATYAAAICGILSYGFGIAEDMGVSYMYKPGDKRPIDFGGFWSIKYDWSIIKEGEKGWKRADQ